jgi:hypothetical protein
MRIGNGAAPRLLLTLAAVLPLTSCGIVGPSCTNEDTTFFQTDGQVRAGGIAAYTVTSPKDSNLDMRLTWPDGAATLGLRATITNCGEHPGCMMTTSTPSSSPGGSGPVPPPWPPGLRYMLVDGSRGKTYNVEVTGDAEKDASFSLRVNTHIYCEK